MIWQRRDIDEPDTVLAGNVADSASAYGGAICLQEYADATLTNSVVAGNGVAGTGTGRGARIFARNDTVTLTQVDVVGNTCTSSVCNGVAFYDNESTELSGVAISAGDGNLFVDPGYADTSATDPEAWDLALAAESPVRDAGNPGATDPDGSRADIGAWGGPGAAGW